jgi:hypothetical protein
MTCDWKTIVFREVNKETYHVQYINVPGIVPIPRYSTQQQLGG